MRSLPTISIIIPTLNGAKQLRACLTSIQKLNYPKNKLEVIVVDNGSRDFVASSKFKLIKNSTNVGFAKAVNQALRQAQGEYFFITNNDVVLEKDCLRNLVQFLLDHPNVGVVGGKTYRLHTKKVLHPAPRYNFYTGLFRDAHDPDKIQEADWIPGSGLCTSRSLWKNLGGFDEGFFFTYEDLDFCLRAKKLGHKVMYYPKAILWHHDGATINRPEFAHFKYYEGYKSKLRLILKHGNVFQITTSFLLQFLIFAPYKALILREKSFIPLLQALLWNMNNLSFILAARKRLRAANL